MLHPLSECSQGMYLTLSTLKMGEQQSSFKTCLTAFAYISISNLQFLWLVGKKMKHIYWHYSHFYSRWCTPNGVCFQALNTHTHFTQAAPVCALDAPLQEDPPVFSRMVLMAFTHH